jgi:hypothetical protein
MKAALIVLAFGVATIFTAPPAPKAVSILGRLLGNASTFESDRKDLESRQRSLELSPLFYRALRGP